MRNFSVGFIIILYLPEVYEQIYAIINLFE
jgi:hypothetical protein